MILIVGGGRLSSYLSSSLVARGVPCEVASSSIPSRKWLRLGPDLTGLKDLEIPRQTQLIVITWSYTSIRNKQQLLRSLRAGREIAGFIKENSSARFLYFSSSIARSEFIEHSLYAASKYLLDCILYRYASSGVLIVRPGLIYGLKECPIRRLISMWQRGLLVVPGRIDASFSVTSARSIADLLEHLLEGDLWSEMVRQRAVGYCERNSLSLGAVYKVFASQRKGTTRFLRRPIIIGKSNVFYRLLRGIRLSKVDLSLSNMDRTIQCNPALDELANKQDVVIYINEILARSRK